MVGKDNNADSLVAFWSKSKYFRPEPLGKRGNDNWVKMRGEYRQLMNQFMQNVEKALLDGHTVILPAYLGRLAIKGMPMGLPRVDLRTTSKLRKETGDDTIVVRVPERNENVWYKIHYEFNAGYMHTYWYKAVTGKRMKKLIQERLDSGQSYYIGNPPTRNILLKQKRDAANNVHPTVVEYDETNDGW